MNRSAITALFRLRQYELEKEEWRLQARQREEAEKSALCLQARARLDEEMQVPSGRGGMDFKRRADGVRDLGSRYEQNQRQLRVAQQARNDQIQTVLGAKRKVEIVEKLLQRDTDARAVEFEQNERKALDDLAAGRSTHREIG